MRIDKKKFGKVREGVSAYLYTLTNNNSVSISISNYGGIITEIKVPDKHGNIGDIVLGFDTLDDYLNKNPYFGSIVGRYANRIANGRLSINGIEYHLNTNEGSNHLHGGNVGFDKVIWDVEEFKNQSELGLELRYLSRNGEECYPGNLEVTIIYSLTNDNELRIKYSGSTDQSTVCNLTNHSYFNLKDAGGSSILDHSVQIFADKYIPIDPYFIPLGMIDDVKGTPFDFRKSRKIGDRINENNEQLKNGLGYDHCYVLDEKSKGLNLCARVIEEASGRVLECYTEEQGVQFYCGNFLYGSLKGKNNTVYKYLNGFCLETGHFPDSPNHPDWPSALLNPGETYNSITLYRFSVLDAEGQ